MDLSKFKCIFGTFLCLVGFLLYASAAAGYPPQQEIESILNVFIDDYAKNDKLPESPITFGILITGPHEEKWTISIDKKGPQKVELKKGFPDQPTFYLVTDFMSLKKIYDGKLNALTAAGRERMSDKTPLDIGFMEGFQPSIDFIYGTMMPLGFHFFNRGKPEVIPFGEKFSRFVHGGNTVIFYYQQGLRIGWYQVKKGMKINEDPQLATNPFPTLFIMTKGEGMGRLGENTMPLKEGMAIYVPAGMVHQYWTESDSGLEFVIIMFGEGA
jgi:mannose-6-phosphate isomerase-like protein (cupin superfamily)